MQGSAEQAIVGGRLAGDRPLLPPKLVAALVLLSGLLLTLVVWDWARESEQEDARQHFDRLAERIDTELQRRLRLPIYGLHGARGVYAASTEVRGDEFRAYVESRQIAQEFPGIRGFGFIERVPRAAAPAFVARMRAEAGSDFALLTSGNAPDHYVVKYIEPLTANRAAWGFDLGSEPVRRAALERAVHSGETTLSGRIVLQQDETRSPGFLLLTPVYRRGADPRTPEQRERALVGLIYAPLVAREILGGLANVAEGLLDVQIYMGNEPNDASLVYASHRGAPARRQFESLRPLDFGGSRLLLRIGSLPSFEQRPLLHGSGWLLGGGAVLSLVLAMAAWLLYSGRARALLLAREMTAELDRLAHVARATTNAVFSTDRQLRINWINEGFTRLSGYSSAEALGRTPDELLGSGRADPAALRQLHEAVAAGRGCRVEILNRRKDGSLYWVDTELQPLHDQHGRLSGFIEISLDISERKRAAELLWQERERLNSIIEGTQAGTWEWNVQTNAVRFNERWAGMLGYTLAELEPIGFHTWTSHAHAEDLAAAEQVLQRHLRGDLEHYMAEVRVRHKLGHWVWVLTTGKLFAYTADGEPLSVAGIHLDITERKRMEQELRTSEAVLERTGRIAGVGGWQLDLRSMALLWTDQTFRIHDLPPQRQPSLEEALGYYDLAGRLAVKAAARRAFKLRESADMELRMTTALGRQIWVRAVGEPVFEGDRAVLINGTLQDITERRALEDSMRRSNQVLRSVLDNLPCALSVFDGELKLLAHNQQFRSLLDFPDELFEQRQTSFEEVIRYNAARGEYGEGADIEATVADIIERARHPGLHQFERVRPNGTALEVRGAPMPGGGFVTTYTDISERKRLEKAQRRFGELLQVMMENLPCALVVFDAELLLQACNEQFRQLLELPEGLLRLGRTSFQDLVRHYAGRGDYGRVSDVEALVSERVADARRPGPRQFERQRSQGQALEVRSAPMPDGGIVITYVDVTERKRMEAAQQRSSELMRVMLENLPCGLTMFDAQMQLMLSNSSYARMYDLDEAFFADAPVTVQKVALLMQERHEYGDLDTEQALAAAVERARSAMQAPHFWERQRPGGPLLEMRSAPLPSGGFVTTYTDVTEQRRAAAELAQTLALLKAVLASSSKVAIIATDTARRISVFNRGAEQMLGYTAAELVGRQGATSLHVPEDLAAYGAALSAELGETLDGPAALIHPAQLGREVECRYLRKDGSKFPALRVVTEMRDNDGSLYGYLGVAFDITRQKEVEASLQAARDSAEQASQAKSQFLANMSHEIRTPMNAILGMLKLLQRTPLDARQRDYARKTEGAARSLLLLLNDILDFSKIEAGRLGLDPQPFRLERLVQDLRVVLQANLGEKPLTLRFEIDEALPEALLGDALRLQQVLINLGGNAIKFTARGEVVLSVRQLARQGDAALIEFRVRDSGIGIASEHQQKIFAGFTQAEASTTRRFGGTGLGLSISQQLVELMGGHIELQSVLGQGSEFFFHIWLPVTEVDAVLALVEGQVLPGQRLLGLRLLVVEDNLNNQQVVRELLEDEGAVMSLAGDGRQALALLAQDARFDAVLMDVQMPEMDGYAATRAIRADPALAGLPVIAMTANAMTEDLQACREAGMDEHVGKPFELEHLVAVICRLSGHRPAPTAGPTATTATTATTAPGLPAELQQQARAQGLDVEGALQRLMGKTALFTRMSASFADGARSLPARLRELLADRATRPAAEALHSLRGLAATLGADRLAELARQGEQLLKAGSLPEPAWVAALEGAIERDTAALQALAGQLHEQRSPREASDVPMAAATLDVAAARSGLEGLMGLLRSSDMAALEALERLREVAGARLDAATLEELDEAMAMLDFARALQYCEQLIGDLP